MSLTTLFSIRACGYQKRSLVLRYKNNGGFKSIGEDKGWHTWCCGVSNVDNVELHGMGNEDVSVPAHA